MHHLAIARPQVSENVVGVQKILKLIINLRQAGSNKTN